jgi:integrase
MTVYRHQKKCWRFDYWKHGVRHRKAGFQTKEAARAAEAEARKKLGRINTDFIKLCEKRLDDLKLKRTDKHFNENETLLKNLILRWADRKEITKSDVQEYLNEVAVKSKPKANKHLRLIKAVFNFGIKMELIDKNPARGIDRFPYTKKKRYIPSEEDIKKVLTLASPMDRLYLLVIIHTLGRITSINRLKWKDVHADYVSLYTRKAKNSDLKEIRIPINQVLTQNLERIEKKGEYVFINPQTEEPYFYRSKFLRTLCKKAGVKYFSFHALRDFGASKLDNMGVALTDLRDLLGHSRSTTTDEYLQSLRGSTKEAIKKLEDLK